LCQKVRRVCCSQLSAPCRLSAPADLPADTPEDTPDAAAALAAIVARAEALADSDDPEVVELAQDVGLLVAALDGLGEHTTELTTSFYRLLAAVKEIADYANETYDIPLIAAIDRTLHANGVIDQEATVASDEVAGANRAQRRAGQREAQRKGR
jgi:hypothetical protein